MDLLASRPFDLKGSTPGIQVRTYLLGSNKIPDPDYLSEDLSKSLEMHHSKIGQAISSSDSVNFTTNSSWTFFCATQVLQQFDTYGIRITEVIAELA
ncbi:hypothetical protein [Kitasatospora cineracea]|nr:hypothetical protein [Kitasatospora cineracea]